ncbi:hypothetical protein MPTK1_7g04600 [Marchantia polymorpha subsp. ruderalis]|uniref:Uncharacterized protein n=2 Tax=Marchantia polymorpha TaxID=3197 RepID=A0AAF6BW50_MARPO|nr:hypothetical protein MARPO_0062s0066 [Marchantia polymorpha]BBN16234.1 hypothetical protein Mp_7g04600 [Marchantia polymorpha subsp. ruderalis]|eukprot:PTQ36649.1 hypothetical protein MARPO_0062s0066 [Marchantia polymorpha]
MEPAPDSDAVLATRLPESAASEEHLISSGPGIELYHTAQYEEQWFNTTTSKRVHVVDLRGPLGGADRTDGQITGFHERRGQDPRAMPSDDEGNFACFRVSGRTSFRAKRVVVKSRVSGLLFLEISRPSLDFCCVLLARA